MLKAYFQQIMTSFQPYKKGRWCYEDGFLMNAFYTFYQETKNKVYFEFVKEYYDEMIGDDGQIKNYQLEEYNIDNIAPGITLFFLYQETNIEKYLLAIETLGKQLLTHPRTNAGNYWHKKRYPYQVWLDGIYMGQVFRVRYALLHQDQNILNDVLMQLKNLRKDLFDEKGKLYVHAYDESKSMQWANKENGKSPNIWSRSLGWLAMAYIDMIEDSNHPDIKELFVEMMTALEKYHHEYMFLQLVNLPDLQGNYHETSGSLMLAYAYLKGARLKILDQKYYDFGKKVFNATIDRYFYSNNEGYHLGGTCEVAGLDNERRDGSTDYYLSEKIVVDEVKGVAPLILAYSEILKMK